MMKLRKNLLVGSMAALLALGLTACPQDDEADTGDPSLEEDGGLEGEGGEDTFEDDALDEGLDS